MTEKPLIKQKSLISGKHSITSFSNLKSIYNNKKEPYLLYPAVKHVADLDPRLIIETKPILKDEDKVEEIENPEIIGRKAILWTKKI